MTTNSKAHARRQADDSLSDDDFFARHRRPFRVRPWRPSDNDDELVRAERADERGWFTIVWACGVKFPIRLRFNPRELFGLEAEEVGNRREVENFAAMMLERGPHLGVPS